MRLYYNVVYKAYIKRGDKSFGPYNYESYRDENGKVRTRYIPANKSKEKINGLFLISLLLLAFLSLAIVFYSNNQITGFTIDDSISSSTDSGSSSSDSSSDSSGDSSSETSSSDSSSTESGSSGGADSGEVLSPSSPESFDSSDVSSEIISSDSSISIPSQDSASVQSSADNSVIDGSVNSSSPIVSDSNSGMDQEPSISENLSIDNSSADLDLTNVSSEELNNTNISVVITANNESELPLSGDNITINQSLIENITLLENLTNETLIANITNETLVINETIVSFEISIKQYGAVIGKPVKWEKIVKIDSLGNDSFIEVNLTGIAENISVKRIDDESGNEQELEDFIVVQNLDNLSSSQSEVSNENNSPNNLLTGNVILNYESSSPGILSKLLSFLKSLFNFRITGNVVSDVVDTSSTIDITLKINEPVAEKDTIVLEYYTESPQSFEENLTINSKGIVISGPDELHYQDILAFSELPYEVKDASKIKLYWTNDSSGFKEEAVFEAKDYDNNSLIDSIEWVVPHLSNQTYEIILITKAEHLDENRTFISDIYEQVRALDGNYSEPINNGEYVRVTFERNLTNLNDITIYARNLTAEAKVEIYTKDRTEKIAEISLNGEGLYKTYLTGLITSTDKFDLKIIGSVEFDYITDPVSSFSNFIDNSGTFYGAGTGRFNVTLANTNGTVWLNINGTNITATNLTASVYNVSYTFTTGGNYSYQWYSYGSGTSNTTINSSAVRYFLNAPITSTYLNGSGTNLTVLSFTILNSTNWTAPSGVTNISVLVVGGGGAGGQGSSTIVGGGGGAGGLIYQNSYLINSSSYNVTVGSGGAINPNGENSTFGNLTAIGGGGGGNLNEPARGGGSGGGGRSTSTTQGGSFTNGQGSAGGTGQSSGLYNAGGGGGYASVGANASTTGGNGGGGVQYSLSGTAEYYSCGGGGGGFQSAGGFGANGNGGNGGSYVPSVIATNAKNHTGSGGGGGGGGGSGGLYMLPGSGGSGIVIISYVTPAGETDTLKPTINFTSPTTSGLIVSRNYIEINVTANDTNLKNITIFLYNSTGSLINSTNSTTSPLYVNFSSLSNGIYYFNATAYDLAGNFNSTETRNITLDITAPNATILNANATFVNNSVNFTLNVSDDRGLSNATLNIYNASGLVNSTIVFLNGVTQATIGVVVNLVEGAYTWFWNVFDLAGNFFSTQNTTAGGQGNFTITVDTTKPIVVISPLNQNYSNATILVDITVNETYLENVWFNWNGTDQAYSIGSPVYVDFTEGSNTLIAYANDSAGNINSTNVSFVVDTIAPTIELLSPANGFSTTSNSLIFKYNVSEVNTIANCSIIVDGSRVNNNSNVTSFVETSATISGLSVAGHIWSVNCTDSFGNIGNSSTRSFTINSLPVVAGPSAGGGGGGAATAPVIPLSKEISVNVDSFNLNLISGGESLDKFVITNNGENDVPLTIKTYNLDGIVTLKESSIVVGAGEDRVVEFEFVAPTEPGIYTGKIVISEAGGKSFVITFALNVDSEKSLFDVILDIPAELKLQKAGDTLKSQITLIQMGKKEKEDVTINYVIKDFDGKVYSQESETLMVFEQKSYEYETYLIGIPPGDYVLGVEALYQGGVATSSSKFIIAASLVNKNNLPLFVVFAISLVIFAVLVVLIKRYKNEIKHTQDIVKAIKKKRKNE